MIKSILRLTRPKQWIKNMFVFIPMFFGGELFDLHSVWLAVLTFFAFSLVASRYTATTTLSILMPTAIIP